MRLSRAASLLLVPLAAGCALAPLPAVTALKGQDPSDQEWDAKECRWEAQRVSDYDPNHSPAANFIQDIFFWGTAGAAVGGTITGLPATTASEATEGLIAGAGAGSIAGGVEGFRGRRGFERAFRACMESRGYTVAAAETKEERK
ncbi:MAG: hypothetical protein HYY64_18165 [Candidatus Rokubacteria bacterium]|nr:hypothetical protein [Candidatus Rokubacteria bacterium]